MDLKDLEDLEFSDTEIDDKKHDKLVEDILNLNKIQHLKKPSRTEPTLNVSEFNLVKSSTGQKGGVQIGELTKVLKSKQHAAIGKKLSSTVKKVKTLPKPLEKPQADKIRRIVGYEKNKLEFDKWDAFVDSNRAATHVQFPLVDSSLSIEEKKPEAFPSSWRVKSELQQALEKIEKVEVFNVETEDQEKFPLSIEELLEQRKEAAKLRAHQSYKEAKARRQNKIKSKKYHRIQRGEKIKQQLKAFEELQKTDPEEALKKLGEIEKSRAQERFSLRHKGTGQWAKNKQIRAKYDKESRQMLAQQLSISRDLTQKLKKLDSDSEDEGIGSDTIKENDPNNPWVSGNKLESEFDQFVTGYKKYWTEQNKHLEKAADPVETEIEKPKSNSNLKKTPKTKDIKPKQTKSNTVSKSKTNSTDSEWVVTPLTKTSSSDIEHMFDKLEKNLKQKALKESKKVKANLNTNPKNLKRKEKPEQKIDLSMPSKSKKHKIDEEMLEEPKRQNIDELDKKKSSDLETLKKISKTPTDKETKKEENKDKKESNIDPTNFIKTKATKLNNALPDILLGGDEDEENQDQRDVIIEAFEDDDIAQDFVKDKAEEIEKDAPKDINLVLPGWGSWGGTNIKPSKRKQRRFIIKAPKVVPRKDDNKGALIINEKAQNKVRDLMVSDVPFPFKTVKDFEASIRAPIGNTFVPETAYKKLIEPAVKTKMGAVIEPASRDMLVNKKKK